MFHNTSLQQSVLAELIWDPRVTSSNIGVTAKDGVVTLTGHVETLDEKHAAEEAAKRVKGVKALAEEIEVRIPFDAKRTDEEIGSAVLSRLAWDVSVPSDSVQVKVEDGWVTLSGEVDWHFQAKAAAEDVRRLHGVVGVSDMIIIKPAVDAANLSDDIMHALHRSWFFDTETVRVSATGGNVSLSGTVRSAHERDVAAATAWRAPGATGVENYIAIA